MFKKCVVLVVFFLLVAVDKGFCARPFLTEDAGVSPARVVGVEAALDARSPADTIDSSLVIYGGVGCGIELNAEIPYQIKGDVSGKIETFNIGAKLNLIKLNDEEFFTLASVIENLPKQGSELGYSLSAVVSKSAGPLNMHANLGACFTSEKFVNYIWGIGAELPVSDALSVCTEVFSESTLFDIAFADNHITGLIGFTFALSEKLVLDAGVRLPLTDVAKALDENNEPTEEIHYIAGITFEF